MEFLRKNQRFSFLYGNKPFEPEMAEVISAEDGYTLTTTYTLPDGLVITNIAKKIGEYGAYDWVTYFKNTGTAPTQIISELWDCVFFMPFGPDLPRAAGDQSPMSEKALQVHAPTGSDWSDREFYCDIDEPDFDRYKNLLYVGNSKEYSASGGRSSEKQAPYFNIHHQGHGFIAAIGWTGQWYARVDRDEAGVTFRSKIQDTHFKLLPGEEIRTSSVVILPYESDVIDGQNKWRRLLKRHYSWISETQAPPVCMMVWGGTPSDQVIADIRHLGACDLPVDYVWMDAGWYGMLNRTSDDAHNIDWAHTVGDWRVNPYIHPNKLQDVREEIDKIGKDFLLWFEPERVRKTYNPPILTEHPEYLLMKGALDRGYLWNLGDENAFQHLFSILVNHIETLRIGCFRNDFNEPLAVNGWRANDTEDRQGITEIKYIMGLYRLWDQLHARFPNLLIDNCASGGRRLDVEMMKRTLNLWRTDAICTGLYPSEIVQAHGLTFPRWLPYTGNGCKNADCLLDSYLLRSSFAPALVWRSSPALTVENADALRAALHEFRKVQPFLSCDFYPLTEPCSRLDTWCAWQYNRPEQKDGILQVFRRPKSEHTQACYCLRGLSEDTVYRIADADTNQVWTFTGKVLMEDGFSVVIPQKRTAKLFFITA